MELGHDWKLLRCILCMFFYQFGSCSVLQDKNVTETPDYSINPVVLGAICLAFLVILVLVVVSCGGCDDMSGDVASESHPACGKQSSNFSPVVGDANTGVLMSSHSMGENASMIAPQNLPYSLQPASTQGFTGYQSSSEPSAPQAQVPAAGRNRPVFEPPPPTYDQLSRQGSLSGYGY